MDFEITDRFIDRHLGSGSNEIKEMLNEIGFKSSDELMEKVIHKSIRLSTELDVASSRSDAFVSGSPVRSLTIV